ncbi:MAG: hypothetical protein KGI37_07560 [Alphaproteobacteria bacterium]|nr:hypothetical protein [Alphaproteobacteria bacterium]
MTIPWEDLRRSIPERAAATKPAPVEHAFCVEHPTRGLLMHLAGYDRDLLARRAAAELRYGCKIVHIAAIRVA